MISTGPDREETIVLRHPFDIDQAGSAMRIPTPMRALLLFGLALLAACTQPVNSPYPAAEAGKTVLYSAFEERPKHLDPARSYSENEYVFLGNIYEPPLQYHYLKRPYRWIPLTAESLPDGALFRRSRQAAAGGRGSGEDRGSEYEIRIRPGIRYQPHPASPGTPPGGKPLYIPMTPLTWRDVDRLADFPETGTRELTAADYVYQIRRLAHPRVQSPIAGVMADYIQA
jgi:oligopeptide transport system substrate-binding protein